jgi:hypothetical protein
MHNSWGVERITMMGKLVNHEKAKAYLDTISDPIVQTLIQHAHSLLCTGPSTDFEGEFDLLFYYRLLESLLGDRERLAKLLLTGEAAGHTWAVD